MTTNMVEDELLERSPFLTKLHRRRLAPARWQQLVASATASRPPCAPSPWDCCGSSCKPCVKELYREELRCWTELHPDGPDEDEDTAENEEDETTKDAISTSTESKVEKKRKSLDEVSNQLRLDLQKMELERASPKLVVDVDGAQHLKGEQRKPSRVFMDDW